MKRLLYVFGTRPEAIKLAPLVLKSKARPNEFETYVCATGQHKEMLDQVLEFFDITPDYNLAVMKPGQTLFDVTTGILSKIENVINEVNPDVIIVQGDTTTAFVGAVAGFYKQIKVAHVEAGLRTGDIYSPFPEEANRVLISRISDYHFPPTELSRNALLHEHVPEDKVFKVGNTVTDAIIIAKDKVADDASYKEMFKDVDFSKKIILVTAHRRESFGQGMENICTAFKKISERDDVEVVFPVHLNPNVREMVSKHLSNIKNVHLYDPFDYPEMVWIMNKAHIVLTDSGGIQEEAPSLGKPVLVLREVTERPEGIDAGTAMLVGTNKELIIQKATELLDNKSGLYDKMAKAVNPYGDGHCSEKILDVLSK